MKITFLAPVHHDGKPFQPSDTADIDRVSAAILIGRGYAEPFDAKATAKAEAAAKAAEAEAAAQAQADAEALAKAKADADAGVQSPDA